MAWDNIPKLHSYSLTDLNDFTACNFKFFVKHHLDKKYEIEEGSSQLALGVLLDQSIKLFHDTDCYEKGVTYLPNLVNAAVRQIKEQVASKSTPSFYSAVVPFLTPELIAQATKTFQDYYAGLEGKINKSIGPVGFCQRIIKGANGKTYKIWGGPDTFELGPDGIPEVVDYKSRLDIKKGKAYMDMDLMPKIYTLLSLEKLLPKGYTRVRFVVRFWQDPTENSFYEEFDLREIQKYDELFFQMIEKIQNVNEYMFCNRSFCKACNSPKREEYINEISEKFGVAAISAPPVLIADENDELAWLND